MDFGVSFEVMAEQGEVLGTGGAGVPIRAPTKNTQLKCALFFPGGENDMVLAAHQKAVRGQKISALLGAYRADQTRPHVGLSLAFPRGEEQIANDKAGFGVVYGWDESKSSMKLSDAYTVHLEFDLAAEGVETEIADVTEVVQNTYQWSGNSEVWTAVNIKQKPVRVRGYGLPFANHEDPEVHSWVADNMPIYGKVSLREILNANDFWIMLPLPLDHVQEVLDITAFPQPAVYPYGYEFTWETERQLERLKTLVDENSGPSFAPARYAYGCIEEHLVSVAHSAIQDQFWLHEKALTIKSERLFGYMAVAKGRRPNEHYVVIDLPKETRDGWGPAWQSFTRDEQKAFKLVLYTGWDDSEPECEWDCKFVPNPQHRDELVDFPVTMDQLVLLVRTPRAEQDAGYIWNKYKSHEEARAAADDTSGTLQR